MSLDIPSHGKGKNHRSSTVDIEKSGSKKGTDDE